MLTTDLSLRVSGTAVFMTSNPAVVPTAFLHNLKHNQILHERVVLLTVQTASTPYVNDLDRLYVHRLSKGFLRVIIRYGFMEDPDVPSALKFCNRFGEGFDMMETTFYVSRETVIPRLTWLNILPWRARLFAVMSKNATSATDLQAHQPITAPNANSSHAEKGSMLGDLA